MKPYISFRGVRTNLSVKAFIALFLAFIAIGFAIMWMVFGGVFKFGGWWAILAYILLTIEVTVNSRKFATIPWDGLRGIVNFVISISALIYYWV